MLLDKLKQIEEKYEELTRLLSDPEIFSDYTKSQKYSKERSELEEIVQKIDEYKKILSGISEAEEIINAGGEDGLKELAEAELEELREKKPRIEVVVEVDEKTALPLPHLVKGPRLREPFRNMIPATSYSPTQFPAQYHRR